jgi:YegS/Rv2252/BmrU family lipid kinase
LARQATEAGYDVVAAAGGDGTPHEVVNGLVRGDRAEATLGVIPIGSGNDLAYALGISTDVEAAVRRLFTGQPRTIDLARVEDDKGRYEIFDNNLGIGFDAVVVIETESITRIHGFLMYLLAVLRAIAFYYQTPHLEIRFDEETIRQEVLFIAMGLGPRGGGGFLLTPDAELDDHLIDSCTVNPIGRLTMLRMLTQVMKGTHVTSRHVTMRQNRRITITSANMPLPVHVDGEVFAYHQDDVRRLTVTTLPSAIQVMV